MDEVPAHDTSPMSAVASTYLATLGSLGLFVLLPLVVRIWTASGQLRHVCACSRSSPWGIGGAAREPARHRWSAVTGADLVHGWRLDRGPHVTDVFNA